MFQWVRVGLEGVVRHDGRAAVTWSIASVSGCLWVQTVAFLPQHVRCPRRHIGGILELIADPKSNRKWQEHAKYTGTQRHSYLEFCSRVCGSVE